MSIFNEDKILACFMSYFDPSEEWILAAVCKRFYNFLLKKREVRGQSVWRTDVHHVLQSVSGYNFLCATFPGGAPKVWDCFTLPMLRCGNLNVLTAAKPPGPIGISIGAYEAARSSSVLQWLIDNDFSCGWVNLTPLILEDKMDVFLKIIRHRHFNNATINLALPATLRNVLECRSLRYGQVLIEYHREVLADVEIYNYGDLFVTTSHEMALLFKDVIPDQIWSGMVAYNGFIDLLPEPTRELFRCAVAGNQLQTCQHLHSLNPSLVGQVGRIPPVTQKQYDTVIWALQKGYLFGTYLSIEVDPNPVKDFFPIVKEFYSYVIVLPKGENTVRYSTDVIMFHAMLMDDPVEIQKLIVIGIKQHGIVKMVRLFCHRHPSNWSPLWRYLVRSVLQLDYSETALSLADCKDMKPLELFKWAIENRSYRSALLIFRLKNLKYSDSIEHLIRRANVRDRVCGYTRELEEAVKPLLKGDEIISPVNESS